jgi:hypothetical protein
MTDETPTLRPPVTHFPTSVIGRNDTNNELKLDDGRNAHAKAGETPALRPPVRHFPTSVIGSCR